MALEPRDIDRNTPFELAKAHGQTQAMTLLKQLLEDREQKEALAKELKMQQQELKAQEELRRGQSQPTRGGKDPVKGKNKQ